MATRKLVDSWVVTNDFWARVEPLILVRQRLDSKEYFRKPSAGRPPTPARQVFEAVMYVLRTGCQWKALPKERFGSASAVHKRFLEWEAAGVFESLWQAGLAEYDQMEGIAWRWQSIDAACLSRPWRKRPSNPTRRIGEKKGEQATLVSGRPWRPVVVLRDRGEQK